MGWCFVVVAGAHVVIAVIVAGACILVVAGECILVARGGTSSSLQGHMRRCGCRCRCRHRNKQRATLLLSSWGGDNDDHRHRQEDDDRRRGVARGGALSSLQGRMHISRCRCCCWGVHPRPRGGVHPHRTGWCFVVVAGAHASLSSSSSSSQRATSNVVVVVAGGGQQ